MLWLSAPASLSGAAMVVDSRVIEGRSTVPHITSQVVEVSAAPYGEVAGIRPRNFELPRLEQEIR